MKYVLGWIGSLVFMALLYSFIVADLYWWQHIFEWTDIQRAGLLLWVVPVTMGWGVFYHADRTIP